MHNNVASMESTSTVPIYKLVKQVYDASAHDVEEI